MGAQPPSAPAQPNQPTAKDVIKGLAKDQAAAKPATDPIERIKEEGLKKSQVMDTLGYLTDVIGPRLTGSPAMRRANEWTRSKLAEGGLERGRLQPWGPFGPGWALARVSAQGGEGGGARGGPRLEPWGPFGRGWSLERFSAQVVEPQCIPLIAYPKAWSPGLGGPIVAEVIYLDAASEADLAKFKGRLKGAVV